MKEKWIQICQIQGYEEIKDCYWISNADEDKIVNKSTGKQLKSRLNEKGYKRVDLRTIDGKAKTCKIYVIKAKAFLYTPNPIFYNVIRHLNDVKTDNTISNLAWGTQSDNVRDSIRNGHYNYEAAARGAKIGGKIGGVISGVKTGAVNGVMAAKKLSKPVKCLETGIIYSSIKRVERQTGIDRGSISLCCRGKRHTAGGFHWTYVNKEVNNDELECEQVR